MGNERYTRRTALKVTQNVDSVAFANSADSFLNAHVLRITTRTDGKTFGGATIVTEAVLKTLELSIKDTAGQEIHLIPLARVLQLSQLGYGYGLEINDKIDFANSFIKCNDPAALTTGHAVELTFEFTK